MELPGLSAGLPAINLLGIGGDPEPTGDAAQDGDAPAEDDEIGLSDIFSATPTGMVFDAADELITGRDNGERSIGDLAEATPGGKILSGTKSLFGGDK